MYALRMDELMGRVDSRISTILMMLGGSRVQRGSEAPPQIWISWPVIAAAAGLSR